MSQDETKEALKEALKEWLDERIAKLGKWAFRTIAATVLTAVVSFILARYGFPG